MGCLDQVPSRCSGSRPLRPADIAARPYQSEVSAGDSPWRGAAGGRYGALKRAGKSTTLVLFVLLIVGSLLAAWKITGPALAWSNWHDDLGEGMEASQVTGKPVLVLYHADWSKPGHQFKREVLGAPQIVSYLRREYVCVKIDLTDRAGPNQEMASEFGVRAIPTIQIFDARGRPIGSRVGSVSVPEMLKLLETCRAVSD